MTECHGIKCDRAFVSWLELEKVQFKIDDPMAVKCLLQRLEICNRLNERDKMQGNALNKTNAKQGKMKAMETFEQLQNSMTEKNDEYAKLQDKYERLMERVFIFISKNIT